MPWSTWGPMRLSKLYSNKPDVFEPVEFVAGLNVVMAEIRLPENRKKDTHNLGKTTLGRLLDFGFLSGKDPKFSCSSISTCSSRSSSTLRLNWKTPLS